MEPQKTNPNKLTTQVSLAKALKIKSRLAGRLSKVTADIVTNNSILVENKDQAWRVGIEKSMNTKCKIVDALIELKTALYKGNLGIQESLFILGEKKSEIDFYNMLPTREGKERHSYQNTEVSWDCVITKEQVDERVKVLEAEIDSLQDVIDSYNHTTKITLSQLTLDLAS